MLSEAVQALVTRYSTVQHYYVLGVHFQVLKQYVRVGLRHSNVSIYNQILTKYQGTTGSTFYIIKQKHARLQIREHNLVLVLY